MWKKPSGQNCSLSPQCTAFHNNPFSPAWEPQSTAVERTYHGGEAIFPHVPFAVQKGAIRASLGPFVAQRNLQQCDMESHS